MYKARAKIYALLIKKKNTCFINNFDSNTFSDVVDSSMSGET